MVAVAQRRGHHFSKTPQLTIDLIAGQGVVGDGHCGERVKHRSRARYNPTLPNLRQVHLFAIEFLDELRVRGFDLAPGEIGENVTTRGIDLIALPAGTRLALGSAAVVELTGLRNPCVQMDRHMPGLMAATLDRDTGGGLIRKAGVMAIVVDGGSVMAGDAIAPRLPPKPWLPLTPV